MALPEWLTHPTNEKRWTQSAIDTWIAQARARGVSDAKMEAFLTGDGAGVDGIDYQRLYQLQPDTGPNAAASSQVWNSSSALAAATAAAVPHIDTGHIPTPKSQYIDTSARSAPLVPDRQLLDDIAAGLIEPSEAVRLLANWNGNVDTAGSPTGGAGSSVVNNLTSGGGMDMSGSYSPGGLQPAAAADTSPLVKIGIGIALAKFLGAF